MITLKTFENCCDQLFSFLVDNYGYRKEIVKKDTFDYYITYKNNTTAVRISYEPREGGIFVMLSRLIDGKMPEYPIFIHDDTIINSFYIDDIVKIKTTSTTIQHKNMTMLDEEECISILSEYAKTLKQYGSDILTGDFGLFEELNKLVKNRAKVL